METEGYEHENKKICKYGIQREDCRKCLFENLCRLEKVREKHKNNKTN